MSVLYCAFVDPVSKLFFSLAYMAIVD
jgi:hypothetical protein